jgi:hypothetical protein
LRFSGVLWGGVLGVGEELEASMNRSLAAVGAFLVVVMGPSRGLALDAGVVLHKMGFPADAKARVSAGEFVETALTTSNDRDLNVGIAFVIEEPPAEVSRRARAQMVMQKVDPDTIAYGKLEGEGTTQQLAGLRLTDAQVAAYAAAAAGTALNLSSAEITALAACAGEVECIRARVAEQLLARYRAYRARGLAGISSYDRGGAASDPGADMAAVNATMRNGALLPAGFYDLLDSYPAARPDDLDERFYWSQFRAHDVDTVALVHSFERLYDGDLVSVQRHFYASAGYNMVQAVVGLLPVAEGTLVVYANHTSTDQVAGFGGSAKRGLGRKIMAAQLRKLFSDSRKLLTQ